MLSLTVESKLVWETNLLFVHLLFQSKEMATTKDCPTHKTELSVNKLLQRNQVKLKPASFIKGFTWVFTQLVKL